MSKRAAGQQTASSAWLEQFERDCEIMERRRARHKKRYGDCTEHLVLSGQERLWRLSSVLRGMEESLYKELRRESVPLDDPIGLIEWFENIGELDTRRRKIRARLHRRWIAARNAKSAAEVIDEMGTWHLGDRQLCELARGLEAAFRASADQLFDDAVIGKAQRLNGKKPKEATEREMEIQRRNKGWIARAKTAGDLSKNAVAKQIALEEGLATSTVGDVLYRPGRLRAKA